MSEAFPTAPEHLPPGEHFVIMTTVSKYDGYDNDGKAWAIEVYTTRKGRETQVKRYTEQRENFLPAIIKVPAIKTTVTVEIE